MRLIISEDGSGQPQPANPETTVPEKIKVLKFAHSCGKIPEDIFEKAVRQPVILEAALQYLALGDQMADFLQPMQKADYQKDPNAPLFHEATFNLMVFMIAKYSLGSPEKSQELKLDALEGMPALIKGVDTGRLTMKQFVEAVAGPQARKQALLKSDEELSRGPHL